MSIDIRIRPINEFDTENIIKWRNSEHVRSNFIFQDDLTVQMHEEWLNNKISTGQAVQFIIETIEEQTPLGSIYLRDIDTHNSKAEYGVFIGEPEYLSKGIGQKATKLILSHGFETLKLNKIFLRVLNNNTRAISSYEKLGFIKEGLFKEDVKIKGIYHDILFMAIFNPNNT